MAKKILFLLGFCLVLSVCITLGQKKERDNDGEKPQVEAPEPNKPTKRESETKPPYDSSKVYNPPPQDNSNSGRDKPQNPPSPSNETRSENNRRGGNDNRDERNHGDRKDGDKNKENDRKRGDKGKHDDDKDDKDRDKNRKRRHGNGGWDPYPNNSTTPTVIYTPLPSYFNKNDIFFKQFESYIDTVAQNYLPYFDKQLSINYKPLIHTDITEITLGNYPFQAYGWAFYYEPDLDDIFIDFSRFGNLEFEKVVLIPRGETIAKVAKKFQNVANCPVIAEDISNLAMDKVYNFNIHESPKGNYDLMLLNKFGDIVKIVITIK